MVEIEIGVLRGKCLDRRIGERALLEAELDAWKRRRNADRDSIRWMLIPIRLAKNSNAPTRSCSKRS